MANNSLEPANGDYIALIKALEQQQLKGLKSNFKDAKVNYEKKLKKASKPSVEKNQNASYDPFNKPNPFNQKAAPKIKKRGAANLATIIPVIGIIILIFVGIICAASGVEHEFLIFIFFVIVILTIGTLQARHERKKKLKSMPENQTK
jgi:Flp pilus assembly protein TadB